MIQKWEKFWIYRLRANILLREYVIKNEYAKKEFSIMIVKQGLNESLTNQSINPFNHTRLCSCQ